MTSIVELQYFGCLEWYKTLSKSTHVLFESCEHYRKMSFRNRCVIAGANGLQHLSVPLQKGRNQATLIRDVRISYTDKWQQDQWKAIMSAYRRSPFFEYYEQDLGELFRRKFDFLFDRNLEMFSWIISKLPLNLQIGFTAQYVDTYPTNPLIQDHRNRWLPKNFQLTPELFHYKQVFEDRIGFQANLSILDLLFCEGPGAHNYFV